MLLEELENAIKHTDYYFNNKLIIANYNGKMKTRENIKNFSIYLSGTFFDYYNIKMIDMNNNIEEIPIYKGITINGILTELYFINNYLELDNGFML